MGKVLAVIAGAILTVGVIVYGSFAIYEGSWSLAKHNLQHSLQLQQQNVNGQASIAAHSGGYQTALDQRISTGIQSVNDDTTNISQYERAGDTTDADNMKNQRVSDVNAVCSQATQLTNVYSVGSFDNAWIGKNCEGTSISPTSEYYYVG